MDPELVRLGWLFVIACVSFGLLKLMPPVSILYGCRMDQINKVNAKTYAKEMRAIQEWVATHPQNR